MSDASAELDDAYRLCKEVAARHGRSYFLATRLLPARDRRAIHALYAFARMVDDIVDVDNLTPAQCAAQLDVIETQLLAAFDGAQLPAGELWRPLLALADTVRRYRIAPQHFRTFLRSMRMDVPGTPEFRPEYATMSDLTEYMRGSAAAIGLQLLPILGTVGPVEEAEPAAAALGEAFQLTNFIRDVGEDLDRGRLYLPDDELAAFGVYEELLLHCRYTGIAERRVQQALAHYAALNRSMYRQARPGIDLLDPKSRPAVRAAFALYAGILDRIERSEFEVFGHRTVVSGMRRIRIAAPELLRATASRSTNFAPRPRAKT